MVARWRPSAESGPRRAAFVLAVRARALLSVSITLALSSHAAIGCASEVAPVAPHVPPPPTAPPTAVAAAPRSARSVVLIVIDSLRADAIADPEATPTLARLAAEGASFEARAGATWTKPAIAALLTSVPPERTVSDQDDTRVPMLAWTLAEVLRCEGLTTASFVANGWVSDRYGFADGYDFERNYVRQNRPGHADLVLTDAEEWIATHRDQRFFVYVHLIDPHAPYAAPGAPPPPQGSRLPRPRDTAEWVFQHRGRPSPSALESAWIRYLYELETRYVDRALADFLSRTDLDAIDGDTLLVVTSDHGELLGERGAFGHGYPPSSPLVELPGLFRVPLVFHGPGRPEPDPTVIALGIDVAPTILEALGLEVPDRFEGTSLGPRHLRAAERVPPIDYRRVRVPFSREDCEQLCRMAYCTVRCDRLPWRDEILEDLRDPLYRDTPCDDRLANR